MLGKMLAIGACVLSTSSAFATPVALPAGSSGVNVPQNDSFATDVGAPGTYTVLDKYSTTVSNGPLTVTFYVDAIRTSGGTIDLVYQVANSASSSATVDSMNLSDFSSVPSVYVAGLGDMTAPAGTNFVTPTAPANPPNTANRSAVPGASINFTYAASSFGDIAPGKISGLTLIITGATNYDTKGAATVSSSTPSPGGGSVGFNGVPEAFGTAAVPEPGSLVLGSLALISGAGVYGFRRLRRK
jgi:hypothetical protein